ncbi:MAG TPA: tetratricopeptide repeat protein [Pyrinomonadaceae bacterium]
MKKFTLAILSLALLVSLAGAAYLFVPRKLKDRIGGKLSSTEIAVKSDKASARSPLAEKVAFHESRIANQPKDAEAHRLLAHTLVSRADATGDPQDYDRAWEQLDQAEKYEPGDLRTALFRAKLLLSRHRFAQSRSVAERGLQRDPDNTDLIGVAGNAALAAGDFDGAEAHYRKLTVLAPKSQDTWANMSYLAEMRGNLDEAVALMERAIDAGYKKDVSAPTLAWLHTILGELEAKRGKLDVARAQYATALEKVTDHRLALEFTADLDAWQGNLKAAEQSYRQLITQQFDPKIQLRLADLLERQGNKDEAARLREESLHFFERVVAAGNEGYLRELARLDFAEGRYQRAAELAARDVELRPTLESRMLYAGIIKRVESESASR